VLPSNFIGLLGIAGIVALVFRRRRAGLSLLVISVVLLAIFGWVPDRSYGIDGS